MPWDRESNEEYDDGFTRDSFERADEDDGSEPGDPAQDVATCRAMILTLGTAISRTLVMWRFEGELTPEHVHALGKLADKAVEFYPDEE